MMAFLKEGSKVGWHPVLMKRLYDPDLGWVDGTSEFHNLASDSIRPGAQILEIGAGRSNQTSRFLSTIGPVTGIDVDPAVLTNDALSHSAVSPGGDFPFADESFDACVSNFVLEHVADADQHLREIHRVLRPGGLYVLRTPNRWHYTAVGARMTPHWFHVLASNWLRGLPPEAPDPFPTFFRLNSSRAITSNSRLVGFDVRYLRMVEKEPSYGRRSPLLFLPMALFERMVNRVGWLAGFRANLFVILEKPVARSDGQLGSTDAQTDPGWSARDHQ